jgi:1,4-dihydroxy-2-naphthoate polyprenyltransferase
MGGPLPIAYTPLGELTVFVFFGLVAVIGTDWVVTGSIGTLTVVASMSIGCLAAAALCVNNHRDIAHDRSVGRRTFAVTFGARGSRRLYVALLLIAFGLVPVMATLARGTSLPANGVDRFAASLLLPLALAPVALRLWRDFTSSEPGTAFNAVLFRTFRLELAFAVLVSIGCVLARSVG